MISYRYTTSIRKRVAATTNYRCIIERDNFAAPTPLKRYPDGPNVTGYCTYVIEKDMSDFDAKILM